jgi:MoaA/NifB/PqqE/SkfB family radical SAM enzyme
VTTDWVFPSWKRILLGYTPSLSIEITRECPLTCPGCYAYGADHLGGTISLSELRDWKGQELIDGVLAVVRQYRPLHVSIVGGEPLVRHRELSELLPRMAALGVHTQVVTSAVRPIPAEWAVIPRMSLTVSVDGLQPEHDARRKPATYERILKHLNGHGATIHCTVTRQQTVRAGYLEEFVRFWSDQPCAKQIWMSLYTPQRGEVSAERLTPADRARVVADLLSLRARYPKLRMAEGVIEVYANTPPSPQECVFARVTTCLSADLQTRITPCQFGGNPECSECGCIASAGLTAIARYRLPGGVRVGRIFDASLWVGNQMRRLRGSPSPAAIDRAATSVAAAEIKGSNVDA